MTTNANDSSTHQLIQDVDTHMQKISGGVGCRLVKFRVNRAEESVTVQVLIGLKFNQVTWIEIKPQPVSYAHFAAETPEPSKLFVDADRIEHHAYEVVLTINARLVANREPSFCYSLAGEFLRRWQDLETAERGGKIYHSLSEADQASMRLFIPAPRLRLERGDTAYIILYDGFGNQTKTMKPDRDPVQDEYQLERLRILSYTRLARFELWGDTANVYLTDKGMEVRSYLLEQQRKLTLPQ